MLGLSDIPDFSSGNEPSSPTDHGGGDAPRIVRRNSRTPRRPIDSLSKEDGNLPPTGQYDSGSKDKTMIKFKPKFKENNAKSSFGLLTNKAGAGAGSDDFEGRSRLDFTIRLCSTMAAVAAGARSIIAGVALLWLFGRLFITTTIAIHAVTDGAACRLLLFRGEEFKRWSCPLIIIHCILDIAGNYVYILSCQVVFVGFLLEPDGTTCDDWVGLYHALETLTGICWFVISCRTLALFTTIAYLVLESGRVKACRRRSTKKKINAALEEICHDGSYLGRHLKPLRFVWTLSTIVAISWALASIIGCVRYIFLETPPNQSESLGACDPLDESECALPFPSNFYLAEDSSTDTGYRVNIDGSSLPITKSGDYIDPSVVNELDGFSTVAPILFYLNGLEGGGGLGVIENSGLPSADEIEKSQTAQSITILYEVESKTLVPHFSTMLLKDEKKPLMSVQPASALSHNKHYAVALVNAAGSGGALLDRSPGLVKLVASEEAGGRSELFRNTLLPSLYDAAAWTQPANMTAVEGGLPENIQMLFDFTTVSERSQLSKIRGARDATLGILQSDSFEWIEGNAGNVQTNKIMDHDCSLHGNYIARTVHLQILMPWFLEKYGSGHRGATMDMKKLNSGSTSLKGHLKFVVQIPCSLEKGSKSAFMGKEMSSVVQYGHGLFYSREELIADSKFMQRMADSNGYLLVSADWRGMSMFDLPIIAKVLIADPSLFRATLDNLIQGYVSMMSMLHYVETKMLMDIPEFLHFEDSAGVLQPIPISDEVEVNFYGISQGGILGAGYNALMGVTGLLQRSILGVPGTPFALIMGKSTDFKVFNELMLLNFYSNREIRIMLSLIQMAWDTVEAGGLLAPTVSEEFPPVLIQAGLGDAEVPSMAAEVLARTYGAKILPGNPKDVYGCERVSAAGPGSVGPTSALTEVLYQHEYDSMPGADSDEPPDFNRVHYCVRQDTALQEQIVEFINEGVIVDPCEADGCLRERAWGC
ncbi:hypothetical protein TrLO_g9253 [Triparma laevis f. longispina]|uniref:Uncharacterized protein n=1 Tax=Triparma laevis f. longispina TaxID=1714387 RepID=A0A9W7FPE2_9STRA|nr:hypothetical protein TrLO_g9253 [Triparma laevis f. longispina]